MADTIAEVQNVIPATGWFFGDVHDLKGKISDYAPVVVFAQVVAFDTANSTLGGSRVLIPLGVDDYAYLEGLKGEEVSRFEKDIFYVTQFPAPEPDDD